MGNLVTIPKSFKVGRSLWMEAKFSKASWEWKQKNENNKIRFFLFAPASKVKDETSKDIKIQVTLYLT